MYFLLLFVLGLSYQSHSVVDIYITFSIYNTSANEIPEITSVLQYAKQLFFAAFPVLLRVFYTAIIQSREGKVVCIRNRHLN